MTGCSGAGGGGPGTKYTYAQLQGLWIKAGGPKAVAPVAAAIALAESGGCSSDLNPTDNGGTQTSWGLWQISNGTHAQPVPGIQDPATNARAAVAKYRGAGNTFAPWGTYTSGAYRGYLNGSTTPDMNVPAGGAGGSGSGGQAATLDAATAGQCLIAAPSLNLYVTSLGGGCMLSKTNARAIMGGGLMAAGVIMVLPGVLILVALSFRKSSGALDSAAGVAAVVPGGQAAAAGLAMAGNRARRTGEQARAARAARP